MAGSRCIGGRFVTLTREPLWHEDGGTLAEPALIRGVAIPAGSEIFVDRDFGDIEVRLHASLVVRDVALGAGDALRFPSRRVILKNVRGPAVLLVLVLLPFLLVRARLAARRIEIVRRSS